MPAYIYIRLKVKDTPESRLELIGQFMQRASTIVKLGMETTTDRQTFDPEDIQISSVPIIEPQTSVMDIFRRRS